MSSAITFADIVLQASAFVVAASGEEDACTNATWRMRPTTWSSS